MRHQDHRSQFTQVCLRRFLEHAGEYRLPEFQRPYVWTREHRRALLQSLLQKIPIGYFVIWLDGKPYQYGPSNVVDGQQRITSLVRMLDVDEPDPEYREYLDVRDGSFVVEGHPFAAHVADLFHDNYQVYCRFHEHHDEVGRSIAWICDTLRDHDIGILMLEGDVEFARTVYMRMNTSGVVVDITKIRASTDGFTVADQVTLMRSS